MEPLVELGLRKPGQAAPASNDWQVFVQGLLQTIIDVPTDTSDPDAAAIRSDLVQYRSQLGAATHAQELRIVAASCLAACARYLRRVHEDQSARETELTELVQVLRTATSQLVGDSSDFHEALNSSADRFTAMIRLDDLREIKRQIVAEVSALRATVAEKEARDKAAVAQLSKRVELLQTDLAKAEEAATIDALTRLPNRATFDRTLQRLMKAMRSSGRPLALAMLDIDDFKKVNDTYGHPVGDRVLRAAGDLLSKGVRQSDFVARYGGEEFAAVLPDADLSQAVKRFAHVLQEIAEREFEYESGEPPKMLRFTLSCGLAQLSGHESAEDFVARADQALYEAKRSGRNRVVGKKPSLFERLTGRN